MSEYGLVLQGGDATVLRLVEGAYTFPDVDGRTRGTDRRVVSVGVVRGGAWVPAAWRRSRRTDWER